MVAIKSWAIKEDLGWKLKYLKSVSFRSPNTHPRPHLSSNLGGSLAYELYLQFVLISQNHSTCTVSQTRHLVRERESLWTMITPLPLTLNCSCTEYPAWSSGEPYVSSGQIFIYKPTNPLLFIPEHVVEDVLFWIATQRFNLGPWNDDKFKKWSSTVI